MLAKSPKAKASMPDQEFLDRLKKTPLGKEVLEDDQRRRREQRQAAIAALVAAESDADDALVKIDDAMQETSAQIRALADQLVAAQERHGRLTAERLSIETRRYERLRMARQRIEATTPPELAELRTWARRCKLSARFEMKQRPPSEPPGPIDPVYQKEQLAAARKLWQQNFDEAKQLYKRATTVLNEIDVLLVAPDVDLAAVSRLRAYLDVPVGLINANAPGIVLDQD